jgi:hypothetical protein
MKVEIKGYYGVKAPRKRCNISCCEKNKKQSATASFLLIIQNVQQRRSKLPDFKIDKDLSHFHQKRRLKARTQVEREGSTKGITEGRTRPARGRSTNIKPPRSSSVKSMRTDQVGRWQEGLRGNPALGRNRASHVILR